MTIPPFEKPQAMRAIDRKFWHRCRFAAAAGHVDAITEHGLVNGHPTASARKYCLFVSRLEETGNGRRLCKNPAEARGTAGVRVRATTLLEIEG